MVLKLPCLEKNTSVHDVGTSLTILVLTANTTISSVLILVTGSTLSHNPCLLTSVNVVTLA